MHRCVLVGVNAKYVHTNLAVRYLKAAAGEGVEICEVTINDRVENIVDRLLRLEADSYGFSCYIWNMDHIRRITEVLKKSLPEAVIFWGGPEVSYDAGALIKSFPWVDYIVAGEGETVFPKFLRALAAEDQTALRALPSVWGRDFDGQSLAVVDNLDALKFPYTKADLDTLKGKIIYYESMRGCPFKCSYCLSSTLKQVRYLPLDRVLEELDFFIDAGVRQVKLVDRTFNVDLKRTKAIVSHLINRGGATNFHFEMAGDLFDEALLALIETAPKGLMQFEIGIQSTWEPTLSAITRKTQLDRVAANVRRLVSFKNCHVHVDLIAGLPQEDYGRFGKSFDDAIALGADMLQLGFLKLLKGTKIREEADRYGYRFADFPPYEVIANDFISARELHRLKDIETVLDRYYNAGIFKETLSWLLASGHWAAPFAFFEAFADYWRAQGYFDVGVSRDQLYAYLLAFLRQEIQDTAETGRLEALVKYDYLCQGHKSLPVFFKDHRPSKTESFELLKNEALVQVCLPELRDQAAKWRIRQVFFQYFDKGVLKKLGLTDKTGGSPGLCVFYEGSCRLVPEKFTEGVCQ
ncbi:MAG: DUF4080 domain-containing protein [Eubacterium sp.]|nr:DUF4080 domain-containing protein [Eubacterium sp.]